MITGFKCFAEMTECQFFQGFLQNMQNGTRFNYFPSDPSAVELCLCEK